MWALLLNCSTRLTLKGWSVRVPIWAAGSTKRCPALSSRFPSTAALSSCRPRSGGGAVHENSPVELLEQDGEGWQCRDDERPPSGLAPSSWGTDAYSTPLVAGLSGSDAACPERAACDRAALAKSPGAYFAGWPMLLGNPAACLLFPASLPTARLMFGGRGCCWAF